MDGRKLLFSFWCVAGSLFGAASLNAQAPAPGTAARDGLLSPPAQPTAPGIPVRPATVPPVANPAAPTAAPPTIPPASRPAAITAALPAGSSTAPATESSVTRVTKGSGLLPSEHGQVWREYDITPYTSRVTTTEKPEQAIIDWILRETGTEVWFAEPLGILSANKSTLRVYHHAEMQQLVSTIVDRFVGTQAETRMVGLRLVTVGNPNWRAKAFPWLRPVEVQSPGIEAWLTSRENAAFLLAELGKRNDFREHSSPNLVIHNGQSQTISRLRPKSYQRQVRPREGALPGFEIQTATIEEGYSIQLSPLFSLDGKTVDAVIKCHIDQVERFVPISLDLPAAGGTQRAQLQVPQIASWRLHERFRWPADNVLVLSCGVVASPAPEARGAASIVSALTTTTGRADALLFIECHGRGATLPTAPTVANPLDSAGKPMIYKGRY